MCHAYENMHGGVDVVTCPYMAVEIGVGRAAARLTPHPTVYLLCTELDVAKYHYHAVGSRLSSSGPGCCMIPHSPLVSGATGRLSRGIWAHQTFSNDFV